MVGCRNPKQLRLQPIIAGWQTGDAHSPIRVSDARESLNLITIRIRRDLNAHTRKRTVFMQHGDNKIAAHLESVT